MMENTLLHNLTSQALKVNFKKPPSVMALIGAPGSGKQHLSKLIAETILDSPYDKAINNGNLLVLIPAENKNEISIESVRVLISALSLKIAGARDRRVVMINNVHNLSIEAQNALLKTLEQPAARTHFILTMPNSQSVLPTLYSRTAQIKVRAVPYKQAELYFKEKYSELDIKAAWSLGNGLAGSMHRLLTNKDDKLWRSVAQARKFLACSKYERLIFLEDVIRNKSSFIDFLNGLNRILAAAHRSSIEKNNFSVAKRLSISRRTVAQITQRLEFNASTKLAALQLVSSLRV